jgi:hypothetical protein
MRIAERAYSLAQEQNDPALIMGANRALACTFYFFGNFDTARKYAISGVEIFRLGGLQSPIQESNAPAVSCLCFKALTEWHFGEIVSCQTSMAEAISLAKELNFTYPLALALHFAAHLAYFEGNAAQVERLASDLIELSTRQNFVL